MSEKKSVAEVTQIVSHFRSRIATANETIDDSTYHLKALTSSQMAFVLSRATVSRDGKSEVDGPALAHWVLKFGLVGWDNVVDENGKRIKFKATNCEVLGRKYPVVTNGLLDGFNTVVLMNLAQKIQVLSGLTDDEERKLDFSSASDSAK